MLLPQHFQTCTSSSSPPSPSSFSPAHSYGEILVSLQLLKSGTSFCGKTPRALFTSAVMGNTWVWEGRWGGVPAGNVPSDRMSARGLHHRSRGEEELLSHSAGAIWPHLKQTMRKKEKWFQQNIKPPNSHYFARTTEEDKSMADFHMKHTVVFSCEIHSCETACIRWSDVSEIVMKRWAFKALKASCWAVKVLELTRKHHHIMRKSS